MANTTPADQPDTPGPMERRYDPRLTEYEERILLANGHQPFFTPGGPGEEELVVGKLYWHLYFEGIGYWPYWFKESYREFNPVNQSDWVQFLRDHDAPPPAGLREKFPTGVLVIIPEGRQ